MRLPTFKDLKNIRGKRVLVRVDFNTPILRGEIIDDTRIRAALPTIRQLTQKGAKVILMTHFGRPKSLKHDNIKTLKQIDLDPIVQKLMDLLKKRVQLIGEWDFVKINGVVKKMKAGQILMLPNLRLHPGEEKNSQEFAQALAGLGQLYVNEAFSVCHREHASVASVPKFLPSYAGLRLSQEIDVLDKILQKPKLPFIVLMGGAKIADKIAMIREMAARATVVLVGGALVVHFFKAMGYGVGASKIDPQGVRLAKALLKNPPKFSHGKNFSRAGKKIILPLDVVVGHVNGTKARVVDFPLLSNGKSVAEQRGFSICKSPDAILDIGPKTILHYARFIKTAQTLVWNGPMGLYEIKQYSHGTLALGRLFAARSRGFAFGVIGGGETIDAFDKTGLSQYVDFISTGGGAMLKYLGSEELPGIEALHNL